MARGRDPLSPGDRALWRRVAASVNPLPGKALPPPPEPQPHQPPPMPAPPPMPTLPVLPRAPRIHRPPAHPEDATLDGEWDRRLRMGRVAPDMVIDLHGHGVEAAHGIVLRGIEDAAGMGMRVVLVVTGKGTRGPEERRGVLKASLGDWLMMSPVRSLVAAMRAAHPRHGGAGAFYVVLRRRR